MAAERLAKAKEEFNLRTGNHRTEVEVDEDTVLDVEETVYEREWDKDSYYRDKYGDDY